MGMYTGYRILAPLKRDNYIERLAQYTEVDGEGPDKLSELIRRMRSGSCYFEFEVDNFGRRQPNKVLSSESPFNSAHFINAFFSTKELDSKAYAFLLARELKLDNNTIVPFMMARYEQSRATEVYFARREDNGEVEIMMRHYDFDILESGFQTPELIEDIVSLYQATSWGQHFSEERISSWYQTYLTLARLRVPINTSAAAKAHRATHAKKMRGRYVLRHKHKRLRTHLKG